MEDKAREATWKSGACPACGSSRDKWDWDWDGDLDNPPAWFCDQDPERCASCGALLES